MTDTLTPEEREAIKAAGERAREGLHVDGHDEPCGACGELCNGFAGDPGLWPSLVPENSTAAWWHVRCVLDMKADRDRLRQERDTYQDALTLEREANVELRADVEKLREALEPFKQALDDYGDDGDGGDAWNIWEHSVAMDITLGHLRQACAALAETEPSQ